MKKILCVIFCVTCLLGCSNKNSSSSLISTSSSSSQNSSSSISSSTYEEVNIDNINEYLTVAITNLLLINNNLDINFFVDDKVYNSNLYFDIKKDIYQYTYLDSILTYQNNNLYLDNNYNHFYINSIYINGASLLSSLVLINEINFEYFEIKKEAKSLVLSLEYQDMVFNLKIKDSKLSSIEEIEIKKDNISLVLTPSISINKYIDIANNNHISLLESLSFLNDYMSYISTFETIEVLFNLDYLDLKINGNIQYKDTINSLNVLLNINENEYDITYKEELLLNNQSISLDQIITLLLNEISKTNPYEFINYLFNLINSKIEFGNNIIIFENASFKEEIRFTLDESIYINFSYLNLNIEIREVTM